MLKAFCRFIFKITGWKLDENVPPEIKRCIVLAAPHTSNWDFVYAMAAFKIYGFKIRYTIKKEWMRFPFSLITKPLGGIGIDRSPKMPGEARISHTEAMINLFKENRDLIIMITPEGSRSRRTEWKTGFWYVAKAADVPICLGYLDYEKKIAGIGKTFHATDMETDLRTIMQFYKPLHGKHPQDFSIDLNYDQRSE